MQPKVASISPKENGKREPLRALLERFSREGTVTASKAEVLRYIIGKSPAVEEVKRDILIAAPHEGTVLVLGETGTGKELVALALHLLSLRALEPFITVNCATIPESLAESTLFGHLKGSFTGAIDDRVGKFHAADRGTIFLDEIGELPLPVQAKLLRTLQQGEIERVGSHTPEFVDVRVIAATNRAVEGSLFRSDLLHRISGYRISMPSLSERIEDIPLLIAYFLDDFNRRTEARLTMDTDALALLQLLHFPGNIRQLRNVVECAAAVALFNKTPINQTAINHALEKLHISVLTEAVASVDKITTVLTFLPDIHVGMVETFMILEALRRTEGNTTKAAELLGVSARKIQHRLRFLADTLGFRIDRENVPVAMIIELFKKESAQSALRNIDEKEKPKEIDDGNEGAIIPKELIEEAIGRHNPFVEGGIKTIVPSVAKELDMTADMLRKQIERYKIDALLIVDEARRKATIAALEISRNQTEAAEKLGIARPTISLTCKKLGIDWANHLGKKLNGIQAPRDGIVGVSLDGKQ